MKNKMVPIVSVAIGIIAFILTYQYLHGEQKKMEALKEQITKGNRQIQVVAAKKDLPSGVAITYDDVEPMLIPAPFVPEQAITDEGEMIIGRKTLVQVKAHKPLLWSDIEGGEKAMSQGLAPAIQHRMRAISLSIGGAAAVSGMVQPGDSVDVLGTFTFPSKTPGDMETVTLTVLQDVTILATGQTMAKDRIGRRRSANTSYSTVTVEVTPREAELLVFSQQMKGSLTLSLRNPTDSSYESELPEINFEKVKEELPTLNNYRQQKIHGRR